MGASLNTGGGGGGRRGRRRRNPPMSEINVTPFVDVMLVLLIIFMVAAPLLTVGVPIDLPETRAESIEGDKDPLAVTVDADGNVFLMNEPVALDSLVSQLLAIAEQGYDERVFVRGDEMVDYGTVMKVMGRLNEAGFRRIGLVTDQETAGDG
ncbi:MAG: protein TolR [Pseudomonadota bacterium]